MSNTELWDLVFRTDPTAVKPITGKSYKGSSPKPYWIIEQATKHFGACGIGWGVEVVSENYINCGPDDVIHSAVVKVWYMWKGVKGEVQQVGGTKVAYKTNAGKFMVDEDAAKKSVTDGMVKCLSMIGFAGDIFSGRWDDSKYVNETDQHFRQEKQKDEAIKMLDSFNKAIADIDNISDIKQLGAIYRHFEGTEFQEQIKDACANRKAQLTA